MNLKKKVAVLLAGAMVLGMNVTAFAAPITPAAPWNAGQEGNGQFEGHVEREVLAVDLPTIKENHTPFNYVLDSEGLIAETSAVAYGGWNENFGVTKEATTNVYFQKEDDKYYNDSQAYTVSNNSSVSLDVVVKVSLPAYADGDVLFVENESDLPDDQEPTASENEDAKIYLALKVGNDQVKALKPGEVISLNKVLKSGYDNYYVSENEAKKESGAAHGYDFVISQNKVDEKIAAGEKPWDDVAFSLTGKANKVKDASGVKAPKLTLTWEYSKYEAPAAPTTFTVTYKANGGVGDDQTESVAENGNPSGPATGFTRDGYSLAGWATTNNGEAAALNTFTITEATTLYAIWEQDVTPVTGEGMTAVTGQAYDYTATFTKGTAYDINFTGVTSATWAATVDGTYASSANISVGTDKVTIAANNWAAASVGSERFVKVSDGSAEYIIRFVVGGVVTGSGMTASAASNVDYTATFTKGTAYDINFTGVTSATWAATVDGTYATSANISVGTNKVTIASGNWAAASAGDTRFVKVSNGTYTYVIEFTIAE
jgi:hypothetical protein